jgi:hypothetical protein
MPPRAGAASRRVGVTTGVTEDALSRDIGSVGHRRMITNRVRPNVPLTRVRRSHGARRR